MCSKPLPPRTAARALRFSCVVRCCSFDEFRTVGVFGVGLVCAFFKTIEVKLRIGAIKLFAK